MKAIFKLLFGGFMWKLAGAVAIGLLIWFAGPLLAFADWHPLESENARLATIAVVLVLWLGKRLLTLARQKLFNSGWQVQGSSPEGLRMRVKAETDILGGIISSQGIKPE